MDAALLLVRGVLGAALASGLGFLPLPGAGATMTSSFGALASAAAAAAARFAAAVGLGTEAALGTAVALGTEAARGFLALSSAAVAAISRFVCLGTDAARGGARGTAAGVGASFAAGAGVVVGVLIDAITFLSLSFAALSFFCASFKNGFEICEILTEVFGVVRPASSFPLPGGLSGAWLCPPCGGGSMPLGASPGPLTSISAKSLGLVFLDIRRWCCFAAIPLRCDSRDTFPTAIDALLGVVPEPDGPDGGCPSPCEVSMGWLAPWLGCPPTRMPVSSCAYVVVEFSLWIDMAAASAFLCFTILSCSNNTVAVSD